MRALPTVLMLLVAGCGDPLVRGTYTPPYFSIKVKLDWQIPNPPDTLPIALLWESYLGSGSGYAAQVLDVRVKNMSVVINNLDIDHPPPPSSIYTVNPTLAGLGVDPTMHFATGTLVAYADNNGNGKLDIEPSDGNDSPDTVLAASDRFTIFDLVAGRPATGLKPGIVPTVPGFSLVELPSRIDPPIGWCDQFDASGQHKTELCDQIDVGDPMVVPAATTPVPLTVVDDRKLQRFACASFWGPLEYPDWMGAPSSEICDGPSCKYCRGYTCPLDVPPAGVPVDCNSDGTAYRYKICSDDPSACGTTFCHYGHGARLPGDPVPAGWPCPTQ